MREHSPVLRRTGWVLGAGAMLTAAAVGAVGPARASNSPPPRVGAASAGQAGGRAAALAAARVQLAAASARLDSLRNQAEVIIERYDKTMVNLHQAAITYRAAGQRLARAAQAESASRRQVAALAAQDYEEGGDAGSMAAMLGNAGGPGAFFNGVADEQQLAQQGIDVLAQSEASRDVADVFGAQARRALAGERSAARQAAALKSAILAAIGRQQAAVAAIKTSTQRLEAEMGAPQAHAYELTQARQQDLTTRQQAVAAQQAQASAPVTSPSAPVGGAYWPSSYSLSQGASARQGDIAADWALRQLGKPYQWGGAGPLSYDCSGLTMDAWAHAGVTLLHWTGYQWPSGPHIPIDQLRRGDLLFYATNTADPATIHHVGIYIGDGEMVDAPYTGADVRIDSIYQPGGLIGATRPAA